MHHHKSRHRPPVPGICPAGCSTPGADIPEPDDLAVSAQRSARAKAKDTTKHNGDQPAVPFLQRPVAGGDEGFLQEGVEVAGSGGAAVRRGQDLDVADRVEPEFGGEAAGDDVDDEFGGLLSWMQAGVFWGVAGEPVEVAEPLQLRGLCRC